MAAEMPEITIGIPTDGAPLLERRGENTLLKNMLIGKGFHWQRAIEALLPGRVEISKDPVFRVLNHVPLETYLRCVIGSEMNPAAPADFLKAHAVISRGWALGKMLRLHSDSDFGKIREAGRLISWEDTSDHVGFHLCSDDHCQRYQGLQPIPHEVETALRATEELVLYSPDGRLVDTRFSKCCGGHTEVFSSCWQEREEACLEGFEDPWCDLSGMNAGERYRLLSTVMKDYDQETGTGHHWNVSVSSRLIETNLRNKFGMESGCSGKPLRIGLSLIHI